MNLIFPNQLKSFFVTLISQLVLILTSSVIDDDVKNKI